MKTDLAVEITNSIQELSGAEAKEVLTALFDIELLDCKSKFENFTALQRILMVAISDKVDANDQM